MSLIFSSFTFYELIQFHYRKIYQYFCFIIRNLPPDLDSFPALIFILSLVVIRTVRFPDDASVFNTVIKDNFPWFITITLCQLFHVLKIVSGQYECCPLLFCSRMKSVFYPSQ